MGRKPKITNEANQKFTTTAEPTTNSPMPTSPSTQIEVDVLQPDPIQPETIAALENLANNIQNIVTEVAPTSIKDFTNNEDGPVPPIVFKRNKYGLLTHIKYVFTDDGYVDWRAMVPKEFLYINTQYKDKLEKLYSKSLDEIDIVADNVEDKYLVILLAGIKYIAKLRGFDRVTTDTKNPTLDYVVARCTIDWISNYENVGYKNPNAKLEDCGFFDSPSFTGIGSASKYTTNGFGSNYLAEIAENRAFCRAVRNFLNINIVSKEEISEKTPQQEDNQSIVASSQKPTNDGEVSSVALLVKSKIVAKGKDFAFLKKRLEELGKDSPDYKEWKDLPPRLCFEILEMVASKESKK